MYQFTKCDVHLRETDKPDAAGNLNAERYAIIPIEMFERYTELAEAQAGFLARLIIGVDAREPRPDQLHCMKRPNPR